MATESWPMLVVENGIRQLVVVKETGADELSTSYVTTDIDTDAELVAVINVITTEVNALRTALNNLGFTTVV